MAHRSNLSDQTVISHALSLNEREKLQRLKFTCAETDWHSESVYFWKSRNNSALLNKGRDFFFACLDKKQTRKNK